MPNVTLHLVLADRVLEHWERAPSEAPFDLENPSARNAFYQGSFGPDIGYFPGGDAFLSDLAHYVRSGRLTRILVERATTERERAYSWGWLTHVLGDHAIHPLVGEALAELETGERGGFVGISDDRGGHVRVEVGLDAHFSERNPRLRERRTTPAFDRPGVRFLGDAYREAYGLEIDPSHLLASHHAAVRMSNHALSTIGVLGSAMTSGVLGRRAPQPARGAVADGPGGLVEQALVAVQEGLGRQSMILAFLNLVPPAEWIVRRVDEVVAGFPERVRLYVEEGLDELPDYNLDTGRIRGDGPGTLCAERTRRRLELIAGGAAPDAGSGPVKPVRYSGVAREAV